MILTFTKYMVTDTGIELTFNADNPAHLSRNEVPIILTDAELAGVATQAQLRTLVLNRLNRKIRANGIASKLDPFIGQSLTV